MSRLSLRLAVLAFVAIASCAVLAAAQADSTLTRPSAPDHGRFAHDVDASGSRGSRSRSAGLRRFSHQMVVDQHGSDLTSEFNLNDETSFDDATSLADQVNPLGLSVLKYDVEYSAQARILDEDLTVLAVSCSGVPAANQATPDSRVSLVLSFGSAADADAAASTYAVDTVVQGSIMWSCVTPDGTAYSPLILVSAVSKVSETQVQISGPIASYQDLFGNANVLLRQPTLVPTSDDETATPSGRGLRHPLAIEKEQTLQLGVDMQETAPNDFLIRADAIRKHQFKTMDNELSFSSPQSNADYLTTDSVTVTFTGFNSIPDYTGRTKLYLKKVEVLSDDTLYTMNAPACDTPKASSDSCSFTVSLSTMGATQRLMGYYFQIEYCKSGFLGIVTCDHSNSPTFWVPLRNANTFGGQGITTYEKSCATMQDTCNDATGLTTAAFVTKALCKLCTNGRDMSFKVSCDNCNVGYVVQVSRFALSYSIDPLNLYIRAETQVDAMVNGNINLESSISFTQFVNGKLTVVNQVAIPPSISIPLGVITLTLGATFSLNAGFDLDFKAQAQATAVANINNVITATAVYDSRSGATLSGVIPPFAFNQQPQLSIDATGELAVGIYLEPILQVGIDHLLIATAQTDLKVHLNGNFSFPAYPALTGNYDVDPTKPAFAHVGNCTVPHLVKFDVWAGLVNSFVAAQLQFNIGSSISSLLSGFDKTKDLGKHTFPDLVYPLVAGCLLRQKSSEPFVLRLNIDPTKAINFDYSIDLPIFSYNLAHDLAAALNVSIVRFAINIIDNNGNYLDDLGNIKQIINTISSATASSTSKIALPANTMHMLKDAAASNSTTPTRTGGTATKAEVNIVDSDNANEPSSAVLGAQIKAQMGTSGSSLGSGVASGGMTVEDAGGVGAGSSSSSSSKVGLIVGVTVGSVVGVALIGFVLYYVLVMKAKSAAAAGAAAATPSAPAAAPANIVANPAVTAVELQTKTGGMGAVPLRPVPPPVSAADVKVTVATTAEGVPNSPSGAVNTPVPPPPRAVPPPPPSSSAAASPVVLRVAPPPPPMPATTEAASTSSAPVPPPTPGKLNIAAFQQFNQSS